MGLPIGSGFESQFLFGEVSWVNENKQWTISNQSFTVTEYNVFKVYLVHFLIKSGFDFYFIDCSNVKEKEILPVMKQNVNNKKNNNETVEEYDKRFLSKKREHTPWKRKSPMKILPNQLPEQRKKLRKQKLIYTIPNPH